jgi:hypothetical protein
VSLIEAEDYRVKIVLCKKAGLAMTKRCKKWPENIVTTITDAELFYPLYFLRKKNTE